MWQRQVRRCSLRESINAVEADIHHANTFCFDTFLTCLGLFHVLIYKVYMDEMPIASPEEIRRASLGEFYSVIYPMLKQLEGNIVMEEENVEGDEDEECGICMEMDCKVVLPNCGHSMCISCFNEWYVRSRSCPFCRGSLKRVTSGDLWVLTSRSDAVDPLTLAKDNLRRFYLYIQTLPLLPSQDTFLMYNYLI